MIAFQSSPSRKRPRPRVPDGVRIYAIGDIHGRVDLLDRVLKRIDSDLTKNPVSQSIEVFLGDYIDRGPHSRQVLDRLVARNRTHRTVFLKGNHETFITGFVNNPPILGDWQRLGGLETLMSYGITPSINADTATQARLAAAFNQALPESHCRFLEDLKSSFTCGDFFCPCRDTAGHSSGITERRGLTVDSPGISSLRGGLQQDHCSWAYAGAETRHSGEPDQH
jgi:serine/threonine protein phosphatase 1